MTSNEQELESIASANKFEVPNFATMRDTLDGMSKAINALLTNSTGWKGETAAAGKAQLADMMAVYGKVGDLTLKIEAAVGKANGAVDVAIERLHGLPASAVPSSVLNAVGTSVHFMGIDFPINGAVGKIASLLAAQREQVARDALDELERNLDHHRAELRETTTELSSLLPEPGHSDPVPVPVPQPTPTTPTIPGGGTGGSGPSYRPWSPTPGLEGPGGRAPSVDDPLTTGTIPGTGTGTPPWTGYPTPGTGTVPTPGPGLGGGIVPGLGGAAGAAGLAAAARVGVGAGGSLGGGAAGAGAAGARLGSGLSGSAGSGVGSAGAGAASGSGAAGAGGRGASSVMGGGGAGGGAPEKEKRSGLGGLIAPKLEDDEEIGPRSAAADAGGRDS